MLPLIVADRLVRGAAFRVIGWFSIRDTHYICGYNLARMHYEIILSPEAVEDLRELRAIDRSNVKAAMEEHLRHTPERLSKSRIKRLRGLRHPQYRLRVGELRVLYDVAGTQVQVLAIVHKPDAADWLSRAGEPL